MSINDLTKCPGGYRILNLEGFNFETTAFPVPGIKAFVEETGYSVPLLCYIGGRQYLGQFQEKMGPIFLVLLGKGFVRIDMTAETVQWLELSDTETLTNINAIVAKYDFLRPIPEIPQPTTADNGKVLKIVAGEYKLVTP